MSGVKHTPGPWELDGIAIAGNCARLGDVCLMGEPAQYPGDTARMLANWEANARLIAAAPDLLAALENLLAVNEGQGGTRYHAQDIARAAIAKAVQP